MKCTLIIVAAIVLAVGVHAGPNITENPYATHSLIFQALYPPDFVGLDRVPDSSLCDFTYNSECGDVFTCFHSFAEDPVFNASNVCNGLCATPGNPTNKCWIPYDAPISGTGERCSFQTNNQSCGPNGIGTCYGLYNLDLSVPTANAKSVLSETAWYQSIFIASPGFAQLLLTKEGGIFPGNWALPSTSDVPSGLCLDFTPNQLPRQACTANTDCPQAFVGGDACYFYNGVCNAGECAGVNVMDLSGGSCPADLGCTVGNQVGVTVCTTNNHGAFHENCYKNANAVRNACARRSTKCPDYPNSQCVYIGMCGSQVATCEQWLTAQSTLFMSTTASAALAVAAVIGAFVALAVYTIKLRRRLSLSEREAQLASVQMTNL